MTQLNAGAMASLGVNPALGRLFLPEEDRKGGDAHKALISHRLWQQRFSGAPGIVGQNANQADHVYHYRRYAARLSFPRKHRRLDADGKLDRYLSANQ
jgi:hypothetical protein